MKADPAPIDEVLRRCRKRGKQVSSPLAVFLFKHAVLCRSREESTHSAVTSTRNLSEVNEQIIDQVVSILLKENCPRLAVLQLQIDFDAKFSQGQEKRFKTQEAYHKAYDDLVRGISCINLQYGNEFALINEAYARTLDFLIFTSDTAFAMASTERPAGVQTLIRKEVQQCLESALPKLALKSFLTTETRQQVTQLEELASVVTGLRTFNLHIGKGGVDMFDVFSAAESKLPLTLEVMQALTEHEEMLHRPIHDLTRMVYYLSKQSSEEKGEFELLRSLLLLLHQLSQFQAYVIEEYHQLIGEMQEAIGIASRTLQELTHLFDDTATALKVVAFPKFDLLGRAYQKVDELLNELTSKQDLSSVLLHHQPIINDLLKHFKKGIEKWKEKAISEGSQTVNVNPRMNSPASRNDEHEYGGFCPVTLVNTQGLLLRGDPGLGTVQHNAKHFVFYTELNLKLFQENPAFFITAVSALLRTSPELITVLAIDTQPTVDEDPDATSTLEKASNAAQRINPEISKLGMSFRQRKDAPQKYHSMSKSKEATFSSKRKKPVMRTTSCETPVHFIPRFIDPHYEWNEWAIRRKALRLANLVKHNYRTSSIQTDERQGKRTTETQVYMLKSTETQTPLPKRTGTPHKFTNVIFRKQAKVAGRPGSLVAPNIVLARTSCMFDTAI